MVALVAADFRVLAALGDGFEGRYVFPAMPLWGLVVGCAVAALPRRFDRDREVLLQLRLPGEVCELARTQAGLELELVVLRRRRNDAAIKHESSG
jgi:hypothetical protein